MIKYDSKKKLKVDEIVKKKKKLILKTISNKTNSNKKNMNQIWQMKKKWRMKSGKRYQFKKFIKVKKNSNKKNGDQIW
jgi:20S proteasome alpha/beta subunit